MPLRRFAVPRPPRRRPLGLLLFPLLGCGAADPPPGPGPAPAPPPEVAPPPPPHLERWPAGVGPVRAIALDGDHVVVGGERGASLWRSDGTALAALELAGTPVCALVRETTTEGFRVAAATRCDGAPGPGARVRTAHLGPEGGTVGLDRAGAVAVAVGPGAREVAVADPRAVEVLDGSSGDRVARLGVRGVRALAYVARGERLVAVTGAAVHAWSTLPYGDAVVLPLGPGPLLADVHADVIRTGTAPGGLAGWDVRAGSAVATIPVGEAVPPAAAWRGWPVVAAAPGGVTVFDAAGKGRAVALGGPARAVAMAADGVRWAAATATDLVVGEDGDEVLRVPAEGEVAVVHLGDGGAIWVGYRDGRVGRVRR